MSPVRTDEAFYLRLFLPDGEESHQVLPIEREDPLNHPAGRDGGQQGEGLVEQGHPHGYGIDVVAVKKGKQSGMSSKKYTYIYTYICRVIASTTCVTA